MEKEKRIIEDFFGNKVKVTEEEFQAVQKAYDEIEEIELSYYPPDGSQDHIDHQIYGKQRECVAELEQYLGEKYNTSFLLY